jgi:hypothetical protein
MEMCSLRGDCRPGDFGKSAIANDGSGAKHEKQEKVRGLVWARLLSPENTICSYVLFVPWPIEQLSL